MRGQMVDHIMGSMRTIKSKVGENIYGLRMKVSQVSAIKASGIMVNNMAKVNLQTLKARAELDYGSMVSVIAGLIRASKTCSRRNLSSK